MMKIKFATLALLLAAALALAACAKASDENPAASDPEAVAVMDMTGDAWSHESHSDDDAVVIDSGHDHETDTTGDTAGRAGHISDTGKQQLVALPGGDQAPVVVNVWFGNQGVWPKQVSIPVGRQVQLVMRNHGQEERHYHITEMPAVGMLWLSREDEMSGVVDVTAEEHAMRHPEETMAPFHICTSRSGICPTRQWIHAHAEPADMDIIVFVTDTPGKYIVTDPLHPEMTATVNVF